MYDIAVIGAGITGTAIARELSRYNLKVIMLEKENDISDGTTKANSAIVHAGYDAAEGSLKAKFNVRGNELYEELARDLGVPLKRIGSFVLAFSDDEMNTIQDLYERGLKNGVPDMDVLGREEILAIEPNLNKTLVGGLHARSAAIVGPWEMAIALAENAMDNGTELRLNFEVKGIEKKENAYVIKSDDDEIRAEMVINCAGLYADEMNDMVSKDSFRILPNAGEYNLFDKSVGNTVNSVIFKCPTERGKGVLVAPTVHGNLIVGPTSAYVENKSDLSTTHAGLTFINDHTRESVEGINFRNVITSFTGLRAKTEGGDFIVGHSSDSEGFINVAGIDSPGLTAAPAIAEHVVELVKEKLGEISKKENFNPKRRPAIHFMELSDDEKGKLIKENPAYGRVVCRCENITEGEIVDAIHRNAGVRTVDGVKRRSRPGSGRCQGGFCVPRVIEILSRELKIGMDEVVKDSPDSFVLTGRTKNIEEAGK